METIIRQSVGIDIAKLSFTACICRSYSDSRLELSEVLMFENSKPGFNQLLKWVRKQVKVQPRVHPKDKTLNKKTGGPISLPAQDELPSNLSTEALLRQ